MTTGYNIFCCKETMPASAHDEFDDVTRTRQITDSKAGAMATTRMAPEGMNVVNVSRPRRGHDY